MPLVSVVIPAYNSAQWIAPTLESVLQQTYNELEVIVVDDGSSDRTVDEASRILGKGAIPFQILKQNNSGPSAARNRGWRSAQGQWIQFLDADDILDGNKIELQLRAHPARCVDVVYSDWQRLLWNGTAWEKQGYVNRPIIGNDPLADLLKERNFIALGSQLFSVEILRRVGGFDESHWLIEDVELHLKIAMANGVFVKAESEAGLFYYRDRPKSLSRSKQVEFVEGCVRNAKMVEAHARNVQACSAELIEEVIRVYYRAARYFAENDWARFEQILADIEALQPDFRPLGPTSLRVLSRLVGYRFAERASVLYRRLKKTKAQILPRLQA